MNEEIVSRLLQSNTLFLLVGGLIAVVAIIAGSIKSVVRSVVRERSRREIAAYIAEGSMNPDHGERLMAAGEPKHPGCS